MLPEGGCIFGRGAGTAFGYFGSKMGKDASKARSFQKKTVLRGVFLCEGEVFPLDKKE